MFPPKSGLGIRPAVASLPISIALLPAPLATKYCRAASIPTSPVHWPPNGVKVTKLFEELWARVLKPRNTTPDCSISAMETNWATASPHQPQLLNSGVARPQSERADSRLRIRRPQMFLAEKFDRFIPKTQAQRAEYYSWRMWQMGSAPILGSDVGHCYAYAPERYESPSIATPWKLNANRSRL